MQAITHNRLFWFLIALSLCLGFSLDGRAIAENDQRTKPSANVNASWMFTGVASNEDNQAYYYYFQLTYNNGLASVQILLVDAVNKRKIHYAFQQRKKSIQDLANIEVARAFLRFNAINNSFVFGLKNKAQQGFNFRVELLEQPENTASEKELSKGLSLKVINPKRMNGHIHWGKNIKEEFVTADVNVYRDVSSDLQVPLSSKLLGVFCFLKDGNRFYNIQLPEEKAKSASQTQWTDSKGESVAVSQFIQIKSINHSKIKVSLKIPKIQLTIDELSLQREEAAQLRAGFATQNNHTVGFCYLDSVNFNYVP